ncbi:MAG: L-seryl-tRNA(Sec) selenium transferase [Bacteroidales bacterium]|jgi:L-seryl-tRNA(Ser) seleniumtransferase|nr:L-seryl-tRNA(Sec) selenium transferase [Bacteroidales bacterium]
MESKSEVLKQLPGVDTLLVAPEIEKLIEQHNDIIIKYCTRNVLRSLRDDALKHGSIPSREIIIDLISSEVSKFTSRSLRKVINATGIVVHTNLGRAPFSNDIIDETAEVLKGYNNLEFDLTTGKRLTRYFHVTELLKFLTGAEDILVVNNNAAAVMMILRSLAKDKEVIVSRGELIEIGGSFRLPDIMAASDCRMVEVGTTNKTRVQDYEDAISGDTALLFKAHRSNYVIKGFTQEASLQELVETGKKHHIPVVYDMGSGLLRKTAVQVLKNEPDVKQTLDSGVDLVTFSGDKLLGASQAGIIAGKKELIAGLKKAPILRALRVGKTTLTLLESALRYYLNDESLLQKNEVFKMLSTDVEHLKKRASLLQKALERDNVKSKVIASQGYCGGGALPMEDIDSYAVRLLSEYSTNKERSRFAEQVYYKLMVHSLPVTGILKKGYIDFDVLTVRDEEIPAMAKAISMVVNEINRL